MIKRGTLVRAVCVAVTVCLTVSSGTSRSKDANGSPASRHQSLLESLESKSVSEAPRLTVDSAGYITFVGAPPGNAFVSGAGKSSSPEGAARAFLDRWRSNFMSASEKLQVEALRVKTGTMRSSVRFSQSYDGLPVYGAEIIVQVSATGNVEMVTADVMRDTKKLDNGKVSVTPSISASDATNVAKTQIRQLNDGIALDSSAPELVIYDPSLLDEPGSIAVAWLLEVYASEPGVLHERAFVDAHSGKVLLHYSIIHSAKNRQIYDSNNTSADPGTLMRIEGGAVSGIADVNIAYDFFGDTYDFYFVEHGRDSIDGAGLIMSATVRYCDPFDFCPYENAFWNGSRMYFGQGFANADDVVAHELTHGVTQYESNLDYVNQSGAINESFSDMWGEWIDLSNSGGTDTAEVRWQMGEDVPGFGVIRDMENPTTFGDPDRMGSPFFYTGGGDSGGVHTNSGVGNKLCYLLTDGGAFNGRTITAMGISGAAELFYECQVNLLTQTSDYAGLYNAVTQAAINLGLTQPQRDNIEQACLAIEIKPMPARATDFAAYSNASNTDIQLVWTNPVGGGFQNVVIRRSTTSYPITVSDGVQVYQGTGTSTGDAGLVQDQVYYYTIFAYYGGVSYSYGSYSAAVAGNDPPAYFTELFTANDNDMHNVAVVFSPDEGLDQYRLCGDFTNVFPTNPATGTLLSLSDDGAAQFTLTGGATVQLYGQEYGSFYVNANGSVTFGGPSGAFTETLDDHFALPRISGMFDDLNPAAGGTIRAEQFADRAVVTYQNVPEYGTANSNNFQIEMFFDGTIQITYLSIAATDGLVGISAGQGRPTNYTEMDLNEWDNDGDLLPNCWEMDNGLDPDSAAGNNGASGDPDLDGLSNADEYLTGADPQVADTDGDGLNDGVEFNTHGTDPVNADTDGDGFSDGEEVAAATSPLNNAVYPTTLLWSDFAYAGTETGAITLPYNTLGEAITKVSAGGIVRIKGNTATNHSAETIRITKQVQVQSSNGAVRIGQ